MPIIEIILFIIIFVWLWIIGGKLNTDEKEIIYHRNRLDELEKRVNDSEEKINEIENRLDELDTSV